MGPITFLFEPIERTAILLSVVKRRLNEHKDHHSLKVISLFVNYCSSAANRFKKTWCMIDKRGKSELIYYIFHYVVNVDVIFNPISAAVVVGKNTERLALHIEEI